MQIGLWAFCWAISQWGCAKLFSWGLPSTVLFVQLSLHCSPVFLQQNMQNVWFKYGVFGSSSTNTGDAASRGRWGHFGRNGALRLWKQHLQAKHWQSSFLFNDLLPTSDLGILYSDLQSINHTECCNTARRALHSETHKSTSNENRNCMLKALFMWNPE